MTISRRVIGGMLGNPLYTKINLCTVNKIISTFLVDFPTDFIHLNRPKTAKKVGSMPALSIRSLERQNSRRRSPLLPTLPRP